MKTLTETHPSIYRLLRSVESDEEEFLAPKELLIGTDETIFE